MAVVPALLLREEHRRVFRQVSIRIEAAARLIRAFGGDGERIRLRDAQHIYDMIRQEPILAALRRPRTLRLEDRDRRMAQYREKAKELRAISEDVILEETRATLLSLANSYEEMARMLEGSPSSAFAAAEAAT